MSKEVPQETKGLSPFDREGKFIIDRPLRVKSCLRCWTPLRYKENRLYCDTCKRFRTAKTSHWIGHSTNLEYLTELEIKKLLELPAVEGSVWVKEL